MSTNMSFDTLLDALPYTDPGYDEPGAKQLVMSQIEEEMRRYRPSKNYLEVFGPINYNAFLTTTLKKEFDRMEQRLPMEMLSMKRYELPPPPPNKISDPAAWLECVENSYAQLEQQETRIVNLELMAEYGSNSWKLYNQTLKSMQDQAEKHLEEIKKSIQAINFNRKNEQTVAGAQIKSLEQKWIGLVSKNYEIECAIVELEKELAELRRKKEETVAAAGVNAAADAATTETVTAVQSQAESESDQEKQNSA